MPPIHPKAIIHPDANLHPNVVVEPFAVIEKNVSVGKNSTIKSGAVLKTGTCIGENNSVGEYALIGADPQDLAFDPTSPTNTYIGNKNVIREFATIHRSTDPQKPTKIGNGNYLMGNVHIAHDCCIHNNTIIANHVLLAGFVQVYSSAFISGGVVAHQKVRIGRNAMVAGLTKLPNDVPPFSLVEGYPGTFSGLNLVGLRREKFSPLNRSLLKSFYHLLYSHSRNKALEIFKQQQLLNPEKFPPCVLECLHFIQTAKRPIAKYRLKK